MIDSKAFCLQCKQEVHFIAMGKLRTCPVCAFQFETGGALAPETSISSEAISAMGIVLRFVLILAAIVVVVIGIVFVGCAVAFKGF